MTNEEYAAAIAEIRASLAGSQADRELQESRQAEQRNDWGRRCNDWAQNPNIGKD